MSTIVCDIFDQVLQKAQYSSRVFKLNLHNFFFKTHKKRFSLNLYSKQFNLLDFFYFNTFICPPATPPETPPGPRHEPTSELTVHVDTHLHLTMIS